MIDDLIKQVDNANTRIKQAIKIQDEAGAECEKKLHEALLYVRTVQQACKVYAMSILCKLRRDNEITIMAWRHAVMCLKPGSKNAVSDLLRIYELNHPAMEAEEAFNVMLEQKHRVIARTADPEDLFPLWVMFPKEFETNLNKHLHESAKNCSREMELYELAKQYPDALPAKGLILGKHFQRVKIAPK